MTDALDVAARALELVRSGDGAQAAATAERSLLLRFARSRPTQATQVDDLSVGITVLREGHLGVASTNRLDAESLRACARAAEAAAEAGARSGGSGSYPGFPDPAPSRAHDGHDAATAILDPAAGGTALAGAFAVGETHGLEVHGVWSAGEVETAIASTVGTSARDRVTDAFTKVTAIAPSGRSGYAAETAVAVGGIDTARAAERAARKATSAGEPVALDPGEWPVVFEPEAVRELLGWLGWLAFNGLAHAEGRGALDGRLGTRVAAPCISLADSPRYPGTLSRAFDAEGVPKSPLPLIQDGVAHRVVHDVRSGALAGTASTGHALAPGDPDGPVPTNLVLLGGGAADTAELCRPIRRGLYVTRLWYVNAVRPKETLITGVTRDGTFLIEDGEVTRPAADMRLTDSILAMLSRAEALTAAPVLTSEGEFYGRRAAMGTLTPALRVGGVTFSA